MSLAWSPGLPVPCRAATVTVACPARAPAGARGCRNDTVETRGFYDYYSRLLQLGDLLISVRNTNRC